ncbi:MAG: M20/M25/M40 family metallo-hydrolase [Acidobacteriota bacterium]
MTYRILTATAIFSLAAAVTAQTPGRTEPVDLAVIHRIRQEAMQNSKVMDHVFQLTDVTGPRLTNSPGFFAAANWVEKQLKEWGIEAHQEKWGPYGRGWNFTHFSAHMVEPAYAPLIGVPLAYTPGTKGKVSGEAMIATMATDADLERYRGKLKGKMLFMAVGRELAPNVTPASSRYTDQQLQALTAPASGRGGAAPGAAALTAGRGPADGGGRGGQGGGNANQAFTNRLNQFLVEQGVLVVVRIATGNSETGTVFGQAGGSRDPKDPVPPPMVALTPEHYNRILRLMDAKIPVKLEFEIEAQVMEERTDSVNVIGEIQGTSKRDEVVMIGAHLDSWHGGTGATDNAAGSAVMIEVLRILKQLKLPLQRTVRMALWSGEEQGLLGSRAYVTEHFSDRDMKLKPEHAKLSGYFNVDNGTGKIRGVYLQGNDSIRPVFEAWLKPFADLGATTLSIRDTGGTDHTNFDAVGLPGFQFIQDAIDYNTRTHHSNMDVYDRVQREDLQQIAAIVASFVYHAANRDELLPREPLPPPAPAGRGGAGNGGAPAVPTN